MADRLDPSKRVVPEQQERMEAYLAKSVPRQWGAGPGCRSLSQENRNGLQKFVTEARRAEEGVRYSAEAFMFVMSGEGRNRGVRSHVLTRLTRFPDCEYAGCDGRGSEIQAASVGAFVNAMFDHAPWPQWFLEWVEDMHVGNADVGIEPQSIDVIRGVLLSPAIDQRRAAPFWEAALHSVRFPEPVFSAPCPAAQGLIFSPYHRRAFGRLFDAVSVEALERFGEVMRRDALRTNCRIQIETREKRLEWRDDVRVATGVERRVAFGAIVDYVMDEDKRQRLAAVLGF